jgi:S-adenosylmethionine hydrolase
VILALTTDFGLRDGYVAAMKGVVLARASAGVQLVDVTHDLDPGDIGGGAAVLAAVAPHFPPSRTVHLVVVDPGVGSSRRLLAVRCAFGLAVGPDNGVLTPLLAASGEAWAIERVELFLAAPGHTFHGRDRMAPVAAWLLDGGRPDELGPRCLDPVLLEVPRPRSGPDPATWLARVEHVDRFGNLITNLIPAELPGRPRAARIDTHETATWVDCYADLDPGQPGMLISSNGCLELALSGRSLAQAWGVVRGAEVVISTGQAE